MTGGFEDGFPAFGSFGGEGRWRCGLGRAAGLGGRRLAEDEHDQQCDDDQQHQQGDQSERLAPDELRFECRGQPFEHHGGAAFGQRRTACGRALAGYSRLPEQQAGQDERGMEGQATHEEARWWERESNPCTKQDSGPFR